MSGLGWLAVGGVIVAAPSFCLAVLRRAHQDYKAARAAVSKAKAVRATAAATFLKVVLVALAVITVAVYAAVQHH